MQPSRRAFLLGRRPVQTPWARFIQRLTLLCQGPCATWARPARTARAAGWRPRATAHARALCAEYGVALALDGAEGTAVGPCLRVDPANLSGLARGRRHAALAGPARRAAGGAGASRPAAVRRPARRHDAGRMAAPAAAGGTLRAVRGPGGRRGAGRRGGGNLGAFGESDERPLRSATLQRLVPALFQLSTGPDAAACAVGGAWAVVTGWTRCGHRRPPRSTWRICCWGTAARWPGCRRCCSRPCRRPGKRRRRAAVGRCGPGGGTPAGCPDQGAVRPGWSFSLTRFRAIAAVRGPRVRWAGPPARAGGRARPAPAAISRRPP